MANNNVPKFPYAAPTDSDLTVASDNAQTTLSSAINSSVTTIPVTSTTSFSVPCLIVIDGEKILANGKTSNTFTGCVRGFDGSTNTTHSDTTPVYGYILAYQHNQIAAEVKSVGSYIFNSDLTGFQTNQNLLTWSEAFTNGYWAKTSGVTVTASAETLPNGAVGTEMLEGASSGLNKVSALPTSIVVGNTYTFSVYVKYDSSQWMLIGQNLAGTEERWAWFDVQNGLIGTIGIDAQASIVPVGGGWYRCFVVTECTNDATKTFDIALAPANGTGAYLGTTTNFNHICGAQVRSGGFDGPHTYIKTAGASFSLVGSGDLILDEGDLT